MKISVLIPACNSSKTIARTLAAVFAQTLQPEEILVMDDGSTDDTVAVLKPYLSHITLIQERNGGVARARNILVQQARGDFLAFLDHDDIWHPEYLAEQQKSFATYPEAMGFFASHHNFYGFGDYDWSAEAAGGDSGHEVIVPLDFLRQYHRAIGKFASMSFFCVPRKVIGRLGGEPFSPEVTGVDDFYFFHRLMLLGPVVFNTRILVAYRIADGSQSASLLKSVQKAVQSMKLLEVSFQQQPDTRLKRAFNVAHSVQRREYGRVLMGVGQCREARKQLWISLIHCHQPVSWMKSLVWLALTRIPRRWQPKWPSEWKTAHIQPV